MANGPYLSKIEKQVAYKIRRPVVPQRQANRVQIETNTKAWEQGIPLRYRAIDAKADIMQRRADRNYRKSAAIWNQVGPFGRKLGAVPANRKEAIKLGKKSAAQNAKAELYRMRGSAVKA